jgi:general secretion pathway protein G
MFNRGRRWWIVRLAIVAILVAIAIPTYRTMVQRSREEMLHVNMHAMRDAITQYTADKRRAPKSLQDLVDAGYFRELPIDPFSNSNSTWKPVRTEQGIVDVQR